MCMCCCSDTSCFVLKHHSRCPTAPVPKWVKHQEPLDRDVHWNSAVCVWLGPVTGAIYQDLQVAVTADWFLWLTLLIFSDTFQIYTYFSPTLPRQCLITVLTEYLTPPLSNQSEWNMSENDDSVAICRALWGPLQIWQPGRRADPGNE